MIELIEAMGPRNAFLWGMGFGIFITAAFNWRRR